MDVRRLTASLGNRIRYSDPLSCKSKSKPPPGRIGAVHGLQHVFNSARPARRTAIIRILRKVLLDDPSPKVRRYVELDVAVRRLLERNITRENRHYVIPICLLDATPPPVS